MVSTPHIRLYISEVLEPQATITIPESQAHYLRHVMRLGDGAQIAAFNERDGEWAAMLQSQGKRDARLLIDRQLAPARLSPSVGLAFAMIKHKSDLVVEKATELGVSRIYPIIMQHSVVKSIHADKLQIHAIEAAEQCERHDIPIIAPYQNLATFLAEFPEDGTLLFADETGHSQPLPVILPEMLSEIQARAGLCLMIGPEGGFSREEHALLRNFARAVGFGMGPRILRADTAAVAALACVMQAVGDWHLRPHFQTSGTVAS